MGGGPGESEHSTPQGEAPQGEAEAGGRSASLRGQLKRWQVSGGNHGGPAGGVKSGGGLLVGEGQRAVALLRLLIIPLPWHRGVSPSWWPKRPLGALVS